MLLFAMRIFSVKSVRYMLAAVGFLCLVFTSGCLVPPLPTKFYTNEDVLAVRCDAHSNVVERLVKKQSVMLHLDTGGMLICEGSGIAEKDFARRVYVDRTNQSNVRYKSLESIDRNMPYWAWFSRDWHFRPILGTNLWAAVHGLLNFYSWPPAGVTNDWEKDVGFDIYVITPDTLSVKRLTAFAPAGRHGFPELMFDSANQHLTYRTRHGYEIYSLLDDTIFSGRQPSECLALVPRDFGHSDTSDKQIWWEERGTNYWAAVVTGPVDEYSRNTNKFVISVYNDLSGKPLYRQEIDMRNFADLNCLRFDATNHLVTYKSGGDDFVYNVLENSLMKKDEAK